MCKYTENAILEIFESKNGILVKVNSIIIDLFQQDD